MDNEALMIIKTTLFDQVKALIQQNHPYDVPEIISMDIADGNKAYLDW